MIDASTYFPGPGAAAAPVAALEQPRGAAMGDVRHIDPTLWIVFLLVAWLGLVRFGFSGSVRVGK